MKKLFAIVLVCLLVLSLGACKKAENNSADPTQPSGTSLEIQWQTLADDDIVGAWEPEESVEGEYVLFTPEGKLRLVYGTVTFDADIRYGEDASRIKSAYTDGIYLYGQWTYKIEDDVLTVSYPETSEEGEQIFEDKVFRKADYNPITLLAKEGFKADDSLVGTWTNAEYGDSYTFTEDGFAIFSQKLDDGLNSYETEIKHSYIVEDGKITLSYYKNNDGEEFTDSLEYTIEGTKLMLGENDYDLNGEGDPALADTTAATE